MEVAVLVGATSMGPSVLRKGARQAQKLRLALHEAAVAFAAATFVLLASFANFLNHNAYPVSQPEVAIVSACLIGLALAAALIYAALPRYLRITYQIVLVFLAVDLNFDGLVVLVVAAAAVIVLNRHILQFVAITAAAVLAIQLIGATYTSGQAITQVSQVERPDLSPLVHIIADEHVGVEGLLGPAAAGMRTELKEFYLQKGFLLLGGAYSEHFHTVNSIPSLLNFGVQQPWAGGVVEKTVVKSNAYFDWLRATGYSINVWQTEFMQFCNAASDAHCQETRNQDFSALVDAEMPVNEKARLLSRGLASLSGGVTNALALVDKASRSSGIAAGRKLSPIVYPRVSAVGALRQLSQFAAALRGATNGNAYFIHVLLPHDPYSLRPDCSIKPTSEWIVRRSGMVTRESTLSAYFDQIRCFNDKLSEIVEALEASMNGREATIIVHGDHGYRDAVIEPIENNLGNFTDEDLVRGHSTLFAIRGKHVTSGYDGRRIPLAGLLASFQKSGFGALEIVAPERPIVVLGDRHWTPTRPYPLPDWWAPQRTNN